jgi:hypothetical protein
MPVTESNDVNDYENALAVCRAVGHIDDNRLKQAIALIPLTKVLFLADSISILGTRDTLANEYRSNGLVGETVQLVSSDNFFTGVYDEHSQDCVVKVDHMGKLAVPKLQFDLIAGRSLICWCPGRKRIAYKEYQIVPGKHACGLPAEDPAVGAHFLRRVWKLLKSTNNRAVAYLHGESGGSTSPMVDYWRKAAKQAVETQESKSAEYQKTIASGDGQAKGQRSYADRKGGFVGEMAITLLFSGETLGAIRVQRQGTGITI